MYGRRKRGNRDADVDNIDSYDTGQGVGWARDKGQPSEIKSSARWLGHHKSTDADGTEHLTEYWNDGGKPKSISFSRPPTTPAAQQPPQTVPNASGGPSSTTSPTLANPPPETFDPNARKTTHPPDDVPDTGRFSPEYRTKLSDEANRFAQTAQWDTLDHLSETWKSARGLASSVVNISLDAYTQPIIDGLATTLGGYTGTEAVRSGLRRMGRMGNFLADYPLVVGEFSKLLGGMAKGTVAYAGKGLTVTKEYATKGLQQALDLTEWAAKNPRAAARGIGNVYPVFDDYANAADYVVGSSSKAQTKSRSARSAAPWTWANAPPGRSPVPPRYGYPDPQSYRPTASYYHSPYRPGYHKPYPLVHRRSRRSAYVLYR